MPENPRPAMFSSTRRSVIAGIVAIFLIFPALFLIWRHLHGQQLWQIVSQSCVPEQRLHGKPGACLKVSLAQHYSVFNDARGPLHTLLIPNEKISGIESPELLSAQSENFFLHGWDTRYLLQQQANFPVADGYLAQAVNSRYGRTQHQLHLHLACLKPDVYQAIEQQKEKIGHQWQGLSVPLAGRHYLAIKTASSSNPFRVLAHYLQAEGDRMDNYGLVSLAPENGEVILLATRLQLTALSLGSAEELLDVNCQIALPRE